MPEIITKTVAIVALDADEKAIVLNALARESVRAAVRSFGTPEPWAELDAVAALESRVKNAPAEASLGVVVRGGMVDDVRSSVPFTYTLIDWDVINAHGETDFCSKCSTEVKAVNALPFGELQIDDDCAYCGSNLHPCKCAGREAAG